MNKLLLILLLPLLAYSQNNGVRSINGSLANSQRLTTAYDDTASYFRVSTSSGVHTFYAPNKLRPTNTRSVLVLIDSAKVTGDTLYFYISGTAYRAGK